jgi:hypothetical protein
MGGKKAALFGQGIGQHVAALHARADNAQHVAHLAGGHLRRRFERLCERHSRWKKRTKRARHLEHLAAVAELEQGRTGFRRRCGLDIEHHIAALLQRTRKDPGCGRLGTPLGFLAATIYRLVGKSWHLPRDPQVSQA